MTTTHKCNCASDADNAKNVCANTDPFLDYAKVYSVIVNEIDQNISDEKLYSLLENGSNVFYINFSYGSSQTNQKLIEKIYSLTNNSGNIQILAGINNRQVCLGKFNKNKQTIKLKYNKEFILTSNRSIAAIGCKKAVYANCQDYFGFVKCGRKIHIGNDVKLKVKSVKNSKIICEIIKDGQIKPGDVVQFDFKIYDDVLSSEEMDDINLAIDNDIQTIVVPQMQPYSLCLTNFIHEKYGSHIKCFIKSSSYEITSSKFVQSVVNVYDGIIHTYSNTVCPHSIEPLVLPQLEQILICGFFKQKKPIILSIATPHFGYPNLNEQYMQFIKFYPDGFQLPSSCNMEDIITFKKILQYNCALEKSLTIDNLQYNRDEDSSISGSMTMAKTIAIAVYRLQVTAVFVCTHSGRTPINLTRYRPCCHIISLTASPFVQKKLLLYKNIHVMLCQKHTEGKKGAKDQWQWQQKEIFLQGIYVAFKNELIQKNDKIILFYHSAPLVNFCDEFRIVSVTEFIDEFVQSMD